MKKKINLIISLIFTFLISGCGGGNKDVFDFSDFKIPDKSTIKNSNQENPNPPNFKNKTIQNKLITYKEKSDVLSSVKIGKVDPFSKGEIQVNKLNSDFKLKGFLNTETRKYAFVSYFDDEGTITEGSIGGENTNLLPNGAKVISVNPKKKNLKINYENKEFIFEL